MVSASPEPPAVGGDFTYHLQQDPHHRGRGPPTARGTVTITGVDNSADEPDKSVFVWATVSNSRGVSAPPLQLLIITDDESRVNGQYRHHHRLDSRGARMVTVLP